MRLILTRHGETEENKKGVLQGHIPGKLSELGICQAKKVALRLKNEKIDYIYSSDLKRTSDTAKEILKFHPRIPFALVEDLRERNFGKWQGKKCSEIFQKNKKVIYPKDGENNAKLFTRANLFLDKILAKHQNDNILFAGHDGINRALIAVITNKKPKDIDLIDFLHNTSICIFEIDKDKSHKIHVFNCKKHLEN